MIIESGYHPQNEFERMEYAGRAISPKAPPVLEQAKEIFDLKALRDIYQAEKRAKGCGCGNCYRDLANTREWYQ